MTDDWYGVHRVLEPKGVLPQPAWKLDSTPIITPVEMLVEVEKLHIDSASFHQILDEVGKEERKVRDRIAEIIYTRGKMHNPITGSGGMLIGKVAEIGTSFPRKVQIGTSIATLVSLTLTPLHLKEIHHIDLETGQVTLDAQAILFATAPFAVLPEDLPESVSLAVLDVCGAPAQVTKLVKPEETVLVLGAGGKSGLLSCYQVRKRLGNSGKLIAMEYQTEACELLRSYGWADQVLQVDVRDAMEVLKQVREHTDGLLANTTINCVQIPDTETSSILATRDGGMIYFFSMATQFTVAALAAEGLGKDISMMIGNGYTAGHAELAIQSLRESSELRSWFEKRYG
ncbi:L-erythro-3,5-diaminohexanoate dehydrogenase [Risungbinella massiliensis]|uniref:L-erythro-3,5-diaminohexanoate dehydrogenase n=1 Tax=Risungbinella massiliensis TaxID=1329796 RepID=UPI0005CBC381|nr:L-erythro-3,5-diaminohexanoate dehydrogenase [Risungbinella massiliensis]